MGKERENPFKKREGETSFGKKADLHPRGRVGVKERRRKF